MYSVLENAILAEKIDWIAYSQAQTLGWEFPDYIDDHWKTIPAGRFYTNGQENKQGVRRFWNTENFKQGRAVVLSGVASDILRDNQLDFLQWVNTTGRKATRIDYALDIRHSKFTPSLVGKHLLAGEAVTHARSKLRIGELGSNNDTQYIGKKSAETYTKVYDKAIEQKQNISWVRIETTYQGSRAKPSLEAYCKGASCRQLIRRHVDFPKWEDWNRIMVNPAAKVHTVAHETRTRDWLLTNVTKSIAKELVLDDGHEFWFRMIDRIRCEIELLEIECPIIDF